MDIDIISVLTVVVFGFIASFLNAIVGGGGLISLPALLFVGLPPSVAIATNKLANTIGNGTSMLTFLRAGKIDRALIKKVVPFVFIGSMFGAFIVHLLSSAILKPLMLIMLIVIAIYTIFKKDWGQTTERKVLSRGKKLLFLGILIIIGFYDGFFGPGTGSFIIFAFLFVGYDFLQAAGNAKALNFTSNLAALLMFLFLGEVNFTYGLIMGITMIFGAYLGSKFALGKGSSYMRIIFIIVTLTLIAKNIWDYVSVKS